jgi:hypothetical protein
MAAPVAACCDRKRSPNDALRDDEDGMRYCGTCWQGWLARHSKPVNDGRRRPSVPPVPAARRPLGARKLYDDDEAVGELEAVVSSDAAAAFHLVSRKLNLVFAAARAEGGQLRRVGCIDSAGELKLDGRVAAGNASSRPTESPFPVNAADHCETPFQAYADLAPALEWLARAMGKDKSTLCIYDPYYCDGSVKEHLASLGFPCCYNEREDFYALVSDGAVPAFDVLVTNPPYAPTEGRDHVESLLKFVVERRRPFFIVQPAYVYTKPYYEALVSSIEGGPRPFFLQPPAPRAYEYETPAGFRDVKSSRRRTSPFATFWYCWLGGAIQGQFYRDVASTRVECPRLKIACSEYFLEDSFKDSSDKTRRRNRNKNKKRPRGDVS